MNYSVQMSAGEGAGANHRRAENTNLTNAARLSCYSCYQVTNGALRHKIMHNWPKLYK